MPIRIPALALILCALASPAFADRCDDAAAQLKSQIEGLSVGKAAANAIPLSHPAAKQMRLGCASRNVSNEVSALSATRKPTPAFLDVVSRAAAIVFTIPKQDTLRGATRCVGRLGLLRGNDIKMRYRRLDLRCTRTKTTASIAITRERE